MIRISGFGRTGPYAGRPGFGRVGNAFGELTYLAGYPDRPPVTPGSATIADYLAGLNGALAALLALRAREATGRGQMADIGLYEPVFRILDELAPNYRETGFVRGRVGPRSVNSAPHSHYPTADDRWVAIACTSDKIFARLAALLGEPGLAGEGRWGAYAARRDDIDAVEAWVEAWTRARTRAWVIAACEGADVPCGPIYAVDEIFEDPQFAHRGNVRVVDDPRAGQVAVPEVVPRLSDTPGAVRWLGPALGADTEDVLMRELGLGPQEIAALREAGAI